MLLLVLSVLGADASSALAASPTVTSISPGSGPIAGGQAVKIIGKGFVSPAKVKIGSEATTVTVVNETEITATTAATAASSPEVFVTDTGGTNTTGPIYTYVPVPTVTSISPGSGPIAGGTPVTIKGTGFVAGSTVKIGSEATEVKVITAEEITAKTSATTAGADEVIVTDTGGSSTGGFKYTYIAPPTAVTGAVSALRQTTTTLNATVNPNGGTVSECKFEYGTTTAYGSIASCTVLPGSGSSPVEVSASVTGLTENTTYHVRIIASNLGGTSKGSDEAFKTLPNSPAFATRSASSISQTAAILNATVNPNGGTVSECKFEYGTTTAYGSIASCTALPGSGSTPVEVSASITGLTANTTYHFRIVAMNLGGTNNGSDERFKTLPKSPAVVTGSASSITQTAASLNATVNPNGGEVNECKLEYGTTESYGSSATCSPLPGLGESPVSVSASLTGLTANTTYHFRIVATNAGGTSKGADQAFTTPPNPPAVTSTSTHIPVSIAPQTPNSTFKTLGATLNLSTYAITFTETVADPGTFSWVLTFQNGKFGVFGASRAKCKTGFVRLGRKCRPSRIVFAKGSSTVTATGTVTFFLEPSPSARRALKNALKQNKGIPVAMTLTFQSSRGGSPVSHNLSLTVKLKK